MSTDRLPYILFRFLCEGCTLLIDMIDELCRPPLFLDRFELSRPRGLLPETILGSLMPFLCVGVDRSIGWF